MVTCPGKVKNLVLVFVEVVVRNTAGAVIVVLRYINIFIFGIMEISTHLQEAGHAAGAVRGE